VGKKREKELVQQRKSLGFTKRGWRERAKRGWSSEKEGRKQMT
jgi:hypothetical protein